MKPSPKSLTIVTMGLLLGGMALFILGDYLPALAEKVFTTVGTIVFSLGMIVSIVGAVWSICTLTNPALRKTYGITTPVVTILIVAFAWSGALVTLYKFKKSIDVRTEVEAKKAAVTIQEVN